MLARIAIVFAGVVLCGVALNLYYLVFCFFTVFLLGISDTLLLDAQYWLCCAGGAATAFFIMRRVWPKAVNIEDAGTTARTETPPTSPSR